MHTRFFLGTKLTPDLKFRLNDQRCLDLRMIPYEGKEYLGLYIEEKEPTLLEIKKAQSQCISSLQSLFPDLRADCLNLVLFPQLFLG